MTRIGLVGFALLFLSKLCFAAPITFTVDFWGSDPVVVNNNVVSAVYDGHIVLGGETDSTGKVTSVTDGTITFGGAVYDFQPFRFGMTELTNDLNPDWNRITTYLDGNYVNAAGVLEEASTTIEGESSAYYSNGTLGLGFIYAEKSPLKWRAARLSVVDVPEPAPFVLLVMGLVAFLLRNVRTGLK